MLKTYKTAGSLAMKIPMGSGGCKQIVFDTGDGDTGVYVTRDEEVQKALEKFHLFGKVYFLDRVLDEKAEEAKRAAAAAERKKEQEENGKTYNVVSLQEARNILIDEYGVNNGEIRGKAKTLAKAQELGIVFKGLE